MLSIKLVKTKKMKKSSRAISFLINNLPRRKPGFERVSRLAEPGMREESDALNK